MALINRVSSFSINGGIDMEAQLSALLPRVLDMVRPVGSYYWSDDPTEPSELFGGTWERIRGKFIYAEDDDIPAGSTGGEKTHTLTVDEMPTHTHTRGTMNITGSVGQGYTSDGTINGGWHNHNNKGYGTGALYLEGTSNGSACTWEDYGDTGIIKFDASRNWTGATSAVGGGQAHNNMPPYESAYCWKRIA